MRINLNKEKLAKIETAFHILQENDRRDASTSLKIIKESLESCFPDSEFYIRLSTKFDNGKMFVMSVYPELSTANKIIDAVLSDKETKAIQKLWEANKVWTIEIDGRILDKQIIDFTDKELTALLLHEIGHVVSSSSIPNRISLVLRYELTKASFDSRTMMRIKPFKDIMSLPIFDSCIADNKKKKSNIREEMKADSFVKKMEYSKELVSAIDKLSVNKFYPSNPSINEKMKKVAAFSIQTLDDFKARRDKLVKRNLFTLAESCNESEFLSSIINEIEETIFEDGENMYTGKKLEFMHERVDDTIKGEIMQEFFLFKGKTPKKIDSVEFNYIEEKIKSIKDETDRMMIVSYINSKIDLVDYYISCLENPNNDNKNIPYNLDELYKIQKKLNNYQLTAMKFKIPFSNRVTYVTWPSGPARALYIPDVDYPEGYEG